MTAGGPGPLVVDTHSVLWFLLKAQIQQGYSDLSDPFGLSRCRDHMLSRTLDLWTGPAENAALACLSK
jgi:hypothetical protein